MIEMTWLQYLIKRDMGLFGEGEILVRFHWKFWRPLKVIGGSVYLGRYVRWASDYGRVGQ